VAEHESMPPRDNPEVAHEASDVNIRAIAGFAIGLVVVAIVIHFALYWLLAYYSKREAELREPITYVEPGDEPPPAPRLQVAPQADLAELRAAEEQALHSYGWIDRDKNIVRLPIDRAMEIIAERGLPFRKQTPQEEKAVQSKTQLKIRGDEK